MNTANPGAVFFLGTRAHYQVLQQPSQFDVENGNASSESVFRSQDPEQQLWPDQDIEGNYANWNYSDNAADDNRLEMGMGVKRRSRRTPSETTLCEKDTEFKPAKLNNIDDCDSPKKPSRRRNNLLTFLTSLARRRRRFESCEIQYLQHLETVLTACTYRDSCRCLDCQSRYFECDESEDSCSEDGDYLNFEPQYVSQSMDASAQEEIEEEYDDEDDEIFVDQVPEDSTPTSLLLDEPVEDKKPTTVSVSSDDTDVQPEKEQLELEMAAGTPLLMDYLLTHPLSCAIM